jgi:hypothetical protein
MKEALEYRRLVAVSFDTAIQPDRADMPMSTGIASDQWLFETSWDGSSIGDVQIYKNAACGPNGAHIMKADAKKVDERGKPLEVPLPDDWRWWGAVPHAKIKSYRFHENELPTPRTVDLPFELPNAERKAKPDEARPRGASPA